MCLEFLSDVCLCVHTRSAWLPPYVLLVGVSHQVLLSCMPAHVFPTPSPHIRCEASHAAGAVARGVFLWSQSCGSWCWSYFCAWRPGLPFELPPGPSSKCCLRSLVAPTEWCVSNVCPFHFPLSVGLPGAGCCVSVGVSVAVYLLS
jgi:hypothetical protein